MYYEKGVFLYALKVKFYQNWYYFTHDDELIAAMVRLYNLY